MKRYEEKNILEKKQSSLKLEEVKEEIQIIENKISDTINKLNALLNNKNEYGNKQSNVKLDDINEEIEILKNKLSNL